MGDLLAAVIRLKIQTYYDILVAIHVIRKAGRGATLYSVARRVGLPHNRLKSRLGELRGLGLVDPDYAVTEKGYAFCGDYQRHIVPVLLKYGICLTVVEAAE